MEGGVGTTDLHGTADLELLTANQYTHPVLVFRFITCQPFGPSSDSANGTLVSLS